MQFGWFVLGQIYVFYKLSFLVMFKEAKERKLLVMQIQIMITLRGNSEDQL